MSDTTECRMVTGGEIADELSDAFPDIPTSKARDAFRTILHAMQNALIRGDRIEIRGFGSFAPRYRQGGMRRNPRSGEKVYAPARWVVIFRAGRTCARRSTRARNERPDCVPTIRINETKPPAPCGAGLLAFPGTGPVCSGPEVRCITLRWRRRLRPACRP